MIEIEQKSKCADLFAGAGGFSQAALNSGFEVSFAVEFDHHAATTYRNNIVPQSNALKFYEQDIRSINFDDIRARVFDVEGGCDLILGGPPCQGYSSHRINNSGVGDERNDLIHSYFDCVEALNPTAFLMENVPGMLWPRHAEYISEFYSRGEASGYFIYQPVVLDARDFGVPQRRKRVFILGVKSDSERSSLVWPPSKTHCKGADSSEIGLQPWKSCAFAFEPAPHGDPNDAHMNHGSELISAFKRTPKNGGSRRDSGRVLPCHDGHDGHKDVYGRIDSQQPAPTMTTACINPSKGRFVHPTEHHGITVRQAARIQTFPDNYVFSGGLTAAGKQVGNAVPVKLGEAILKALKPFLDQARSDRFQRSVSELENV